LDALFTVANVINVAGYFVKDRLWVRALSFVAACCLTVYASSRADVFSNWVSWNLVFATLNGFMLWRLLAERFAPESPADGSAAGRTAHEDRQAS
jgi:hypothetical protein